jgi:lysozyme family protein
MEVIMRIRRTILAPVILAIGTVGALVTGPVLAVSAAATPASAAVASGTAAPAVMYYHG